MTAAAAILPLALGAVCFLGYIVLKTQFDASRGQRRFFVIGFYRAVVLAFGIVAIMVGVSRLLSLFFS